MKSGLPRLVLLTRQTPLEQLLERFGTRAQVEFYLRSRGQSLAEADAIHARREQALATVRAAIPVERRQVRLDRRDLDRFLFAPDDIVVVVGQDGLVANVAKYLRGQLVIGINPDPARYDGVLVPHPAEAITALLQAAQTGLETHYLRQSRCLALAEREDGQQLRALNEVYIGHRSHQSARYRLRIDDRVERQSSSGVIVATGTGATGWSRSICEQRRLDLSPPAVDAPALAWFVREPFPSVSTGTSLDVGLLDAHLRLELHSEMDDGGVAFADGIESDFLEFLSGQSVRIGLAPERLQLLVPRPADELRDPASARQQNTETMR